MGYSVKPLLFCFEFVELCNFWTSMADIFQEAGLPLWLRPYEILVTSSYTALIETIYDTVVICIYAFSELNDFFDHIHNSNVFTLF